MTVFNKFVNVDLFGAFNKEKKKKKRKFCRQSFS